ncbi:MAG: hypothetical protein FJW51_02350 [Actinobacteria bacterium]|nr:hypothetical protein [Actinomycetota bacterium]
MRRERLTSDAQEENTADQAGWMYADLLLALMVIFLATISFVPQFLDTRSPTGSGIGNSSQQGAGGIGIGSGTTNSGASAQSNSGIPAAEYTFDQGLALLYEDFDLNRFVADVERFGTQENLGENFEIVFAQITGGFDEKTESAEKGTLRAIAFSIKMKESGLEYLANTSTAIRSSSDVPQSKVLVRFTFTKK